jgi:hypothetical protein
VCLTSIQLPSPHHNKVAVRRAPVAGGGEEPVWFEANASTALWSLCSRPYVIVISMVIESLCGRSIRGVAVRGNGNVAQATCGVGLVTRAQGIYSAQAPRDGRRDILVRHREGFT